MKNSDKDTCGDYGGHSKRTGEPCERVAGWGIEGTTEGKCKQHRGTSPDAEGESHKNNDNAVSHGLYQSKQTFLENAQDYHKDLYHGMHESLCTDYERKHGHLPEHIRKRLADIALDMVRIDMGDEYEADKAVNPELPLTEKEKQMSESGPWQKEVTSKVEQIKTNISRETRLALKDMGIYNSPEQAKADAMERTLAEILSE